MISATERDAAANWPRPATDRAHDLGRQEDAPSHLDVSMTESSYWFWQSRKKALDDARKAVE